jgi:hypothetical protein
MRRYIHKYRKWAVDERCQCGHARSGHKVLVSPLYGGARSQDVLGGCSVQGCGCARFRRHLWVFEGEPPAGSGPR